MAESVRINNGNDRRAILSDILPIALRYHYTTSVSDITIFPEKKRGESRLKINAPLIRISNRKPRMICWVGGDARRSDVDLLNKELISSTTS